MLITIHNQGRLNIRVHDFVSKIGLLPNVEAVMAPQDQIEEYQQL